MIRLICILFAMIASVVGISYGEPTTIPLDHQRMLEANPYRILGIGSSCIDLVIPVSEEFLTHVPGDKGGAQPIDFTNLTWILDNCGVTPQVATGGSCANTIKALARLGEKTALLGKIGEDSLGEHFTTYMIKSGVLPLFIPSPNPTTRILILVTPDGQRTMRFYEGCSLEFLPEHLFSDYFKSPKLVHIEGFAFRNGNLPERLMHLAKEAGVKVSLDLSSFEIVKQYREEILNIIAQHVDIVFANEDEIQVLTGLSPKEGCLKLRELCPIAVVLMGKEGCLIGSGDQLIKCPTFPATVVDTTGAGDYFASGFLYGFVRDYDLDRCAKLGNLMGSRIVGFMGAELPDEEWQRVNEAVANEETGL